ncbi:MAG TPA: EAL domain-containing protein [Steroidobacteraceae bacterium]|nr:EAL domain-containing protein [Steroidobacteraceae bacterium]
MNTALLLQSPSPSSGSEADNAQDNARMLKTLLANVEGMVYRRRLDAAWTMEFVSSGCLRVTGRQPAELLSGAGISYGELLVPEDRMWVCEAIRCAVEEGRAFDLEYRIVHGDGAIRWVWERGAGVADEHGRPCALEGLIEDITKRKSAEHALREAERRYHGLFDNAIEGIFRTSTDGQFLDANPALAHIYGFESPEELMRWVRDIGSQLYVEKQRREEFIHMIRARGSVTGFESQVYRKNGDVIWISENARAVLAEDGRLIGYEGTVEDITERRLYQVRIEHQANYDTLTGLANRSLLQDRLQQALLTAASSDRRIAVAFVDVDRFKFINDSLGHHFGDELLKTVAARLRSCVRDCDTVARLGGDEFVLLINGHGGPDSVRQLMAHMLSVLSQPWVIEQGEFLVSCSIGVALHPEDGEEALTLLKHADSAMYRAKDSGRNNFQFFTRELNAVMTERLELETHLRRALERNQFVLRYQPRVNLATGQIVGAEALLRWRIPQRGTIAPRRFISLAEETGLIVPIGKWVLQSACAQNKAWQDAGLPPIVVSVNVSPRQFRQENLVQTVAEVLQTTGLDPHFLELELTESMVMHDAPQLVAMLDELKKLGVQMAVDDFGTGYSSLSYLKRFPVDRLKVDRSFVVHMSSEPDDATIVRAIIALGHNLGLKVVAEGVESAQQHRALRAYQCDEAQGFLFSRPVSARDLPRLLSRSKSDPRA